jgi:hypothetical protein
MKMAMWVLNYWLAVHCIIQVKNKWTLVVRWLEEKGGMQEFNHVLTLLHENSMDSQTIGTVEERNWRFINSLLWLSLAE